MQFGRDSTVLLTTSAAPLRSPFFTDEKSPPLGLGLLVSILRNAGHRVILRDPYLEFDPRFPNVEDLTREGVGLVGIYSSTICFADTLRMCERLQRFREQGLWRGRIAVGGPHASVAPGTLPEYVDHVVVGEGEHVILPLAEGKAQNRIITGTLVEDLDQLPRPPYDVFVHMPYPFSHRPLTAEPVYTLNTSRGCPYSCTFCSVGSIWGRSYRAMSAERIVDDVEWLVKDYGAGSVYFREDHFTLSPTRTRRFCELMLERKVKLLWGCESRADSLDPDLLRLMHRAGCRWLYIGVESGSPRMLRIFNKQESPEDFVNAFRCCRDVGISTYASFVVGAPGERPRDLLQTIRFARELNAESVSLNIFVGIPFSALYEKAKQDQLVEHVDENGLLYIKGHNLRVLGIYGPDQTQRMVPGTEKRIELAALHALYHLTYRWPTFHSLVKAQVAKVLLICAAYRHA